MSPGPTRNERGVLKPRSEKEKAREGKGEEKKGPGQLVICKSREWRLVAQRNDEDAWEGGVDKDEHRSSEQSAERRRGAIRTVTVLSTPRISGR